jgi:predicted nucleic acid-binding protein
MICVYASVVVKWLLLEEQSDRADALYDAAVLRDELIVAPPLLPLEITNVLRQRMRAQGGPSLVEATELLDTFLAFAIDYQNPPGLHHRALALADAYGLPAAYDANYLALAEHLGCDFWTDDRRLLRHVGGRLAFVRSLADVEPTSESSRG